VRPSKIWRRNLRFGSKADIRSKKRYVRLRCERHVRFVPIADIAAPEPERGHRRKSLPLAVNKNAYDQRRKGEQDQEAAEYHSQPNTRPSN
jgi:hypothetical protein